MERKYARYWLKSYHFMSVKLYGICGKIFTNFVQNLRKVLGNRKRLSRILANIFENMAKFDKQIIRCTEILQNKAFPCDIVPSNIIHCANLWFLFFTFFVRVWLVKHTFKY